MRRLSPYFPRSHGIPRVDDRRVLSGIIDVIRHDLWWRDPPPAYGPHKTLDNRFCQTTSAINPFASCRTDPYRFWLGI
jgi:transposase